MSRHGWLHEQIARWAVDGLISDDQAQVLRQRYPLPATRWSRLIFAALGAVILGLGVILLFAYNWQSMHRLSKLAVILAAVLAAHLGALGLARRPGVEGRISESLHLLGTMLFGAGIWLIAQLYHIDAHYPNAFLVWSLAALMMAWVLPSVFHGVLTAVLILVWHYSEVMDFHHPNHWAPWLVALGLIPLAWSRHSKALLLTSVITLIVSYVLMTLRVDGQLGLTSLWLFAGALVGFGRWLEFGSQPGSAAALQNLGRAGVLLFLYSGSFRDVAGQLHHDDGKQWLEWLYFGIPVLLLAVAWVGYALKSRDRGVGMSRRREEALILMAMLLLILSYLGWHLGGLIWIAFNLGVLAYGGILIRRGTRNRHGGEVALGCILISVLVFFRFTDLFGSLLLRGLLFVLLGGGLLIVTLVYSRYRPAESDDA